LTRRPRRPASKQVAEKSFNAVILSVAKDLALPAQGKLGEESRKGLASRARFLSRDCGIGMTTFTNVCEGVVTTRSTLFQWRGAIH